MSGLLTLLGLFAACLAAGSLVPVPSEPAFLVLLLTSDFAPWTLLAVATAGNVTGSTINWLIGLGATRFEDRPWFPASPKALSRARAWYHHFGRWSLLLSWVPVLGDPLTVAAGVMREPLWSFLPIVLTAKFLRYAALTAAALAWT